MFTQETISTCCSCVCYVHLDARQPQHMRYSSSAVGTCGFHHAINSTLLWLQVTWAKVTPGCFRLGLPSQRGCTSKVESLHMLTWHSSLTHASYICCCSSISFIHSSLWPLSGSFHTDYNATWQHSLAQHILYYKHQGAYKAGSD